MIRPPTQEDRDELAEALSTCRRPLPFEGEQLDQIIERLVDNALIREVNLGEVVMKQGEETTELYFILSGQLRTTVSVRRRSRLLNYHGAKTFVGERGMLDSRPRSATVDAISDTKLAMWHQNAIPWELKQGEGRRYLDDLYQDREKRSRRPFTGKQQDEVTLVRTGKHPMMLVTALIGPVFLLLFCLALLVFSLAIGVETAILVGLVVGVPAVISLLWGVFNYVDWRDDEYIVTNKRVIHIERYVFYGEERHEAPLTRIQDVTVEASNLWERLLNFYDIKIQTAGAGTIRFAGIRDAQAAMDMIFEERAKAQERREAANVYSIRRALAQRTNAPLDDLDLPDDSLAPTTGVFTKRQTWRLPFLLDYLWPRMAVAEGEKIVWRKHWFIWLKKTWPATLLFLVLTALMIFLVFGLSPFDALGGRALLLVLFLGVAMTFAFLWYIYLYDDWHKDVYIVTNDRIVDVESSSFRLRGEKRRDGTFDVIQNITYVVPSFFHKLLNMGDVTIETAGTAETFTFIGVFNPSAVQQEIFNRMVAYQENKQRRQQEDEDLRRAEWFNQYHLLHVQGGHQASQAKPE